MLSSISSSPRHARLRPAPRSAPSVSSIPPPKSTAAGWVRRQGESLTSDTGDGLLAGEVGDVHERVVEPVPPRSASAARSFRTDRQETHDAKMWATPKTSSPSLIWGPREVVCTAGVSARSASGPGGKDGQQRAQHRRPFLSARRDDCQRAWRVDWCSARRTLGAMIDDRERESRSKQRRRAWAGDFHQRTRTARDATRASSLALGPPCRDEVFESGVEAPTHALARVIYCYQ